MARAALSQSGITDLPSNGSPIRMDATSAPPISGLSPASVPPVNGSLLNQHSASVASIAPAAVKVEPSTISSISSAPAFQHVPPVPCATSQKVPSLRNSSPFSVSQEILSSNDIVQDLKPFVSGLQQFLCPGPQNLSILNNLSQARFMISTALVGRTSIGLPSIGEHPTAMHMSNTISSGMTSSVPAAQTVISSGQPGVTTMAGSGTIAGTAQVAQNISNLSFTSATSNIAGSSSLGMSQLLGNLQGSVSMGHSLPGMKQGNLPGTQMALSGMDINQNMMSGMCQSSISGTRTTMPAPGIPQQVQGMQSLGVNNNTSANAGLPQQTASAMQSTQSKYVKVWEGNLFGKRQGQPTFITKLEGYRGASASESLAANWPSTMEIVELISHNRTKNMQYVGKIDFLIFRAMNQHGFLGQLQEKKLCAFIQLPSQNLLFSVSDIPYRLIGMLFQGKRDIWSATASNSTASTTATATTTANAAGATTVNAAAATTTTVYLHELCPRLLKTEKCCLVLYRLLAKTIAFGWDE